MDKLERYIIEHKEELDVYAPAAWPFEQFDQKVSDPLHLYISAHRSELDKHTPGEELWDRIADKLPDTSLEEQLKAHRQQLDTHEPPEALWDKLSQQLEQQQPVQQKVKTVSLRRLWTAVAAAIVVGIGIGWSVNQWKGFYTPEAQTVMLSTEQLPPELAQAEVHYASLISLRKQEASNFNCPDTMLLQDFGAELQQLDSIYRQLRKELHNAQNKQLVAQAMISNLQFQMELLNKQIYILKQINQPNQQHETTPL